MSKPTSTSNFVTDASESSDDDTIEYEIEVVTSSPSSSSPSSASSTSDHLEANELVDNTEEARAQPNAGTIEVNNDITTSGPELIINPADERGAESNQQVHLSDNEVAIEQQEATSLDEPTPVATAASTTAISETSNVDQSADQGGCTDTKVLNESNTSHVIGQPDEIQANSMSETQVAQHQAIGSNNSEDANESLDVYESNQVWAKTTRPQEDVSYCTSGGVTKSGENDVDINYPQLISSTDNEFERQAADTIFTSNRDLVIETVPSSQLKTQPMQIMMPLDTTPDTENLSTDQVEESNGMKSSLIDDSSRIPSEGREGAALIDDDNPEFEAHNSDSSNTNDLIKTTTQPVGSNDSIQPIENQQYHEEITKSSAAPHLEMHQRQSAEIIESRDNIVSNNDIDQFELKAHQPDSDLHRPSDLDDTRAKEEEPIITSPGPVSVGISVEPPPQQTTNTTGLSLSMSPDTMFRRESFSEDLEREFDEEPEFEPRVVTLKRDQDARLEYELADELGRGRFGTVYHCREHATGRSLAAKFINVRRPEDREDVEREIGIMSKLQHKRLLQLYDAFDNRAQNEMCLITELIEGGELFERIVDDDFDLTEKKAAVFMRQICEGVEYMHSQQIVHLDMKPENILCLSKTGNRIKLIDFGLARQLDPNRPLHVMFGTPDFAAPEVLSYETVTLATDMWSIGVICYVLLSGLLPFMGDNDMQTMANVTKAEFEFDEQAFEPISDLAKDFISKLLIKDPNKRLKPRECLQHAWLQKGGAQLEAAVIERRKSSIASLSFLLSGAQQARLEQLALLASSPKSGTGSTDSSRTPTGPRGSISIPFQQQVDTVNWGEQLSTCSTADAIIPALFSLSKRNLKRYVIRRKWHKTVHAIMALGRMGATLRAKLVP